jgi:hypothetical protein
MQDTLISKLSASSQTSIRMILESVVPRLFPKISLVQKNGTLAVFESSGDIPGTQDRNISRGAKEDIKTIYRYKKGLNIRKQYVSVPMDILVIWRN